MPCFARPLAFIAGAALAGAAAPAFAQAPAPLPAPRPTARVSFYTNAARLTSNSGAPEQTFAEFITSLNFGLGDGPGNGLEYGVDMRHAQPTAPGRDPRLSVYDSFIGARFAGGAWRARVGQMWLSDLGGLGSVAGGLVEFRQVKATTTLGRFRAGGFGGIEPKTYDFGYQRDIRKMGAYAALEGSGGRRHTAGYVRVDHGGLNERSVLTVTNFVPARSRVFVYQAAEYDLSGPAGQGTGGLSYLFVNARVSPARPIELQGIFNRGRSIDARTITDDVLNGRPVPAASLDGLLYESAGGRVTVEILRRVRVHGGYTRDRNNRDSAPTGRTTVGASTQDLAGSGVDLTVSNTRIDRPTGRYDSLYISGGRQVGRAVYLSADYSSSVSLVRYTRSDGLTVELRPETRQFGGSAIINLGRYLSVHAMVTDTRDDEIHEYRVLAGLTIRTR
jgi:hypothetical protein